MANNPYVNRVETADGTEIMDISDSTATEGDVLPGKVFYKANGQRTTGALANATQSTDGLMSATDKTKLDGIAEGATANVGTITGITMNGASKGTSGVVDLGTVITAHQDISGKVDRTETQITDFNNATTTGLYHFSAATNGPNTTDSGNAIVLNSGNGIVTQIATISNKIYVRRSLNGSWNAWSEKTNTPVVDNLTSTSTTSALSAAQGKVLNDSIAKQRYTKEYGANSTLAGIQSDADTLSGDMVGIFNVGYVNSAGSADVGLVSGAWFIYLIKHNSTREILVFVHIDSGRTAYNYKVTTWSATIFFGITDNLTSTSATSALSAKQGKELNDNKVAKSGDTMTGTLEVSNSGEAIVVSHNTASSCDVLLDSASSGNHGIWSRGYYNGSAYTASGQWLIYRNTANEVVVDGRRANSLIGHYEVSNPNFNTVITAGLYGVQGGSPTNYPPTTANKYGTLLVLEYRRSGNNYYTQVFFNHSDEIFYRHSNANATTWNDWYEITTSKNTTDYSSSVTAGQSGTTLSDAYLKKFGNVVTLSCVLKNSSTSAQKVISAYNPLVKFPSSVGLPSQHIMVLARSNVNNAVYDFYVSKYNVDGDTTKGQVIFADTLTLPASGWVKFSVTWIV